MTHKLHIGDGLSLPTDAVTQTFAILAKRGVGKSYTASVMAEEMLKAGHTIIALDPTGAWWGLRSLYPVVIFGGEHADVPLEESAGEVVARSIVENRFPAVLDLSAFRKGQMIRFMVAFAETLYRLNREAVHLFVDEADAFAPQARNYGGDENRMLGAMEDIVRRGRKRGIGCTLITQRPAVLNKNVLTQCEVLVALRLVHPKDIDAIEEWVNVHADPDTAREMIDSLPSLGVGEAWFWSPGWGDLFQRVKVRHRETFDSGATPKAGEAPKRPKHLAEIDLAALGEQIKATVERAKADDPKELKRQLAEARKQLAAKPTAPAEKPARVEVPVLKDGQLARAERLVEKMMALMNEAREVYAPLAQAIAKAGNPPALPKPLPPRPAAHSAPAPRAAATPRVPVADGDVKLGKAEFNVLRALYWTKDDRSTDFAKVCFFAGYSPAASTVGVAMSRLRKVGWVEPGSYRMTPAGLDNVPADVGPKPRGSELREWMRPKVGPAENRILDVLLADPGRSFTHDELADATGYSRDASTVGVALSKLRKFEAIEGTSRGGITAAPVLFE
jgi:hypothetical protein